MKDALILRLQLTLLVILTAFGKLLALPQDSIPESGVDISFISLSNSRGNKVSFEIGLRAYRLERDFKIEGANYYRAYEKRTTPTIEPITLTIPRESTLDSVVMIEMQLDFPYINVFETADTVFLETSEGIMYAYTGRPHISSDTPGFFTRNRGWSIAISGLFVISLVIVIINAHARRIRRIRRENLAARAELSTIKQHNDELNIQIDSLFGERLEAVNKLCNEYFEKKDAESEAVRLSIYKDVERIILSFGTRESLDMIEKTVDTYRNDILKRLREQVPSLSATDIKTITYLYAGFSPKAVCIFTDCKIKNFYNRRLRLREKIANSAALDRDEFLSRLDH